MEVWKSWPKPLLGFLQKIKMKTESVGFRFDYEELFEQTGIVVLVFMHKASTKDLNLFGLAIRSEMLQIRYKKRKEVVKKLYRLYGQVLDEKSKRISRKR